MLSLSSAIIAMKTNATTIIMMAIIIMIIIIITDSAKIIKMFRIELFF